MLDRAAKGSFATALVSISCILVAACTPGSPAATELPSPRPTPTLTDTPTAANTPTATRPPTAELAPAFSRSSSTKVPPGDWSVIDVADVNEDGQLDVVSTNLTPFGISILLGKGNGMLEAGLDIEVDATDYVRIADLDGDGHLDIVAAGARLAVLHGNGDGSFQSADYYDVGSDRPGAELDLFGTAIADLNADDVLDITVANWGSSKLGVLLGKGDATFEQPTLYECASCVQLAAGDLDGDGDIDIVSSAFSPVEGLRGVNVFLNDASGALQPDGGYDPEGNAHAIALADLNEDGQLDVVTANDRSYTVSVLFGNGDGTLGKVDTYPAGNGHNVAVVDLDGDGRLDVVSGSIEGPQVAFQRGNGDGTFTGTQGIAADTAGGLDVADMNGDGKVDLVTSISGSTAQVVVVFLQK